MAIDATIFVSAVVKQRRFKSVGAMASTAIAGGCDMVRLGVFAFGADAIMTFGAIGDNAAMVEFAVDQGKKGFGGVAFIAFQLCLDMERRFANGGDIIMTGAASA